MKRIIALLALLLLLFSACVPGVDPSSVVDSSNTDVSSGDNTSSEDNSSDIPTEPLPFVIETIEYENQIRHYYNTRDIFRSNGWIYYAVSNRYQKGNVNNFKIFKVKDDGSDKQELYTNDYYLVSWLWVEGDYLYYIRAFRPDGTEGALWRMKTDGTEDRLINDSYNYKDLIIKDGWIICSTTHTHDDNGYTRAYNLIKMRTDGSEFKILYSEYAEGIYSYDDNYIYILDRRYTGVDGEYAEHRDKTDGVYVKLDYNGNNMGRVHIPGTSENNEKKYSTHNGFLTRNNIFICSAYDSKHSNAKLILTWYDEAKNEVIKSFYKEGMTGYYLYGNWIFYYNRDEKTIWRIDINGNGEQRVFEAPSIKFDFKPIGEKVFLRFYKDNAFHYAIINYDGTGMVELN